MKRRQTKRSAALLLAAWLGLWGASCGPAEAVPEETPDVSSDAAAGVDPDKRYVVPWETSYASLGDLILACPYILYGEVTEKSEVRLPYICDPEDNGDLYGRQVSVRLLDGWKGYRPEYPTGSYWEFGGKTPDGRYYEHPDQVVAEVGDRVLLFLTSELDYPAYLTPQPCGPLVVQEDGTISIPGEYLLLDDAYSPDPAEEYGEPLPAVQIRVEEYCAFLDEAVPEKIAELNARGPFLSSRSD